MVVPGEDYDACHGVAAVPWTLTGATNTDCMTVECVGHGLESKGRSWNASATSDGMVEAAVY